MGMETQIDADIIKNVDGTAKQRKGSSRFSKKQRDKSKSPGIGNRASCSEPDVEQEMTQTSSDLTSRLEEPNVRMKKLSDVFTTCEESFSDTDTLQHATDKLDENQDEDCVLVTNKNDDDIKTFPLMRTTKVVGGKNPFDQVVETMIQEQQND